MNDYERNIEVMKDLRNRINEVLKDRPSDIGVALTDPMGIPDPVKHKYISFVKSAVRIAAGGALIATAVHPYYYDTLVVAAGALFIIAEALGIAEEMV